MRIIPAIDIINGKCVRLTQGDYSQKKIYNENPLEVAQQFEDAGIKYLHLVDLDGAKSKTIINQKILENIAKNTALKIDFGGGIKSEQDVKIAFDSGASQVTVGSLSASSPDTFLSILKKYGKEKIILGADAKQGKIAIHGWKEMTNLSVIQFISQYVEKGSEYVICTDIAKDGMLEGPSQKLYEEILSKQKNKISLIASGGISSIQDLKNMKKIGMEGCIIGKAIYENKISLKELSQFNDALSC